MLVTFSSKSSGDVVMLEKHALQVLNAIGRNYPALPPEGVITHEQLDESIKNLEAAVASISDNPEEELVKNEEEDAEQAEKKPIDEFVGLGQRAFPLLDMMRKASKGNVDDQVVWRSANSW
ncbi:putative uncharacterized protein [Taylorella asinigenitalis 14/45]|uniref:DUF1840 domain-containing protein n=1 Tax=Taylorella asinigenitalis 14/45 TaxID=1091495 RepID=I7JRP6_9BURK|nr:DUF1840 domain-containing protein [Taylorella asinigenitalis]CCG19716.1 putative uncharacterized protein [Taylorella asinigenitalis 14/45]